MCVCVSQVCNNVDAGLCGCTYLVRSKHIVLVVTLCDGHVCVHQLVYFLYISLHFFIISFQCVERLGGEIIPLENSERLASGRMGRPNARLCSNFFVLFARLRGSRGAPSINSIEKRRRRRRMPSRRHEEKTPR